MKIFLTGITGFLGRHIAVKCIQKGYTIVALVRNPNVTAVSLGMNIEVIHGDIRQKSICNEKINDIDIIIHCAANVDMGAFSNKRQETTNINAVEELIKLAKRIKVKRFIHISTANTIQPGNSNKPGIEKYGIRYSPSLLNYIKTKIIAEDKLAKAFKDDLFPVIILNPTFMLGPESYNLSSMKLIYMAMKNKIALCPKGGKNIVDVRDVAEGVVSAIIKGQIGEKYLLCNTNHSFKEMLKTISVLSGSKAPKYSLPNLLGVIIGFSGSLLELIIRKPIEVNHKSIKILGESHYYSNEKARRELSFNPRMVSETIIDSVNWIEDYGFNK